MDGWMRVAVHLLLSRAELHSHPTYPEAQLLDPESSFAGKAHHLLPNPEVSFTSNVIRSSCLCG